METNAKTIQIFLPDGQPRGIRIAEITTRIVQAVAVPRTQIDRMMKRTEIGHVAVYFLFGESEDQAKPIVYIGQTEDTPTRLKNHNANKDFWQTAVLVISKTHSFTQAHIRFLEWFCISKAGEAGRYHLDNANEGSEPYTTEPMKADLMDAFETASTLVSALGYPIFDPVTSPPDQRAEKDVFYCSGPDAHGTGKLADDGFVVLAGSLARTEISQSAIQGLAAMQDQLKNSGVLEEANESQLRFTQDYLFNTPSAAALVVLARKANGWVEWKSKAGRTLHELRRSGTDGNGDDAGSESPG